MVKVDKKWQKILKVPERMTKNLSLHDIWHFVIFGILLQVDKLTSLTLWRVDMLTSYQEFRIIWFWAPKFETTTYLLTYLLTRVKSRDASASKNAGNMYNCTVPYLIQHCQSNFCKYCLLNRRPWLLYQCLPIWFQQTLASCLHYKSGVMVFASKTTLS